MIEFLKSFIKDTPILLWGSVISLGILFECIFSDPSETISLRKYSLNILNLIVYVSAIYVFLRPATEFKDYIYVKSDIRSLFSLELIDQTNILGATVAAFLYLFVNDFFFYWWHRASHNIGWLWDLHVIHHSDENMNATTATRSHWTVFLLELFITILPTNLILGPIDAKIFAAAGVAATWNFLIHSNVKISFGGFAPVIMGPQAHRIHHSILPHHRDRNFSSLFPIWDILFGTYYHPERGEYPPTGVENVRLETLSEMVLLPFACWIKRIRKLTVY